MRSSPNAPADISISFAKEGFEPEIVTLTKEIPATGAAGFAGNVLAGGLVRMGVKRRQAARQTAEAGARGWHVTFSARWPLSLLRAGHTGDGGRGVCQTVLKTLAFLRLQIIKPRSRLRYAAAPVTLLKNLLALASATFSQSTASPNRSMPT